MRRARPIEERFAAKVPNLDSTECWPWAGYRTRGGYGAIHVGSRSNGTRALVYAHRLAYGFATGPIPAGMCVLHTCDNPPCVNPAHLRLGTKADNTADMVAKGRHRYVPHRGEDHPQARLTAPTVRAIRASYAAGGRTLQSLADEYGISLTHSSAIVRRKVWAHLD